MVETNRRRGRNDPEYELLDTGIFNEDRYFDVFVEYAKAAPSDILIQISLCNRGPEAATLHVLPNLWFRNTWTWWPEQPKPSLRAAPGRTGVGAIQASHCRLGDYTLHCEGNHGEDVKEYYYYLDSTPTHSYMKYLYKYPQNAYP